MPRPLLLLAVVLIAGCRDLNVVTANYATLADARTAGAIEQGWMPAGLPPNAFEIRVAYDQDSPRRWGLFSFREADADVLRDLVGSDEVSLQGMVVDIPARIEWWPVLLRGRLEAEKLQATGLRAYRSRDGTFVFVVNWRQGRAYYWSAGEMQEPRSMTMSGA